MVYTAWIVGGLLSFFGALTYAELGAMKPQPAENMFMFATPTARSWISLRLDLVCCSQASFYCDDHHRPHRCLERAPHFEFLASKPLDSPMRKYVAILATILISLLNYSA